MGAERDKTMEATTVQYRQIECKSLLNKSGISDYTVNCYTGCEHGCVYCYARFAARYSHPHESWGSFVDIKANAPEVLARELKRKPAGHVILSSVCDAWQPAEKTALLTRRCLELLLHYRFSVGTLTKSALAARDLDVMKGQNVDFGVTITTLDAKLAALIEPGAAAPRERLDVLARAKSAGLKTYGFIGPLLPFLSDGEGSLTALLKAVKEAVIDYFYLDKLNLRYGVWPDLAGLLQKHYPALLPEYRKVLFQGEARAAYKERLSATVRAVTRKLGMDGMMNNII